jgi:nicotinamidase-related amidase
VFLKGLRPLPILSNIGRTGGVWGEAPKRKRVGPGQEQALDPYLGYNERSQIIFKEEVPMSHLLRAEEALLLIIDVQERFVPALFNPQEVVQGTATIVKGCQLLKVPILVTEHYPKGLGHTVPEITTLLDEKTPILPKTSFGCCGDPDFMSHLEALGRKQIMICGLEAHVCVNQTVVSLLEQGYQVNLIEDAIGSRKPENKAIALRKLYHMGAMPSCIEMALFELMHSARHDSFKAVQQLIL